jgi:hypothetical protein
MSAFIMSDANATPPSPNPGAVHRMDRSYRAPSFSGRSLQFRRAIVDLGVTATASDATAAPSLAVQIMDVAWHQDRA